MPRHKLRAIDTPIIDIDTHPSLYITVAVFAEWLNITARTVTRLIHRKQLRGFKAGREWRIHIVDAQQFCRRFP